MLTIAAHPSLDLRVIRARFARPLGEFDSPPELISQLSLQADTPLESNDEIRREIRDLLRVGGFKPTGRSKPASEFLLKAAENERLQSINLAVDICNVVSLHSGLPISVIDLGHTTGKLSVSIAAPGSSYIFNPSGQTIDIGGLLCVADEMGPCGNSVKDSQRTKTNEETQETLSLIWSSQKLPGRGQVTAQWYRELLSEHADAQLDEWQYPQETGSGH